MLKKKCLIVDRNISLNKGISYDYEYFPAKIYFKRDSKFSLKYSGPCIYCKIISSCKDYDRRFAARIINGACHITFTSFCERYINKSSGKYCYKVYDIKQLQ